MTDKEYLKQAVDLSDKSFKQGRFPSGAIVVIDEEVVSQYTNGKYTGYNHAPASATDHAFRDKRDQMAEAVLYCSMEPCTMCLTRAYWAGIRKIVFAIPRTEVSASFYESKKAPKLNLHEDIQLKHMKGLQDEALKITAEWEEKKK